MRNSGGLKWHPYFEGWYFKQQSGSGTAALIPSLHVDGAGRSFASLQVITDGGSYGAEFPAGEFELCTEPFSIRIGDSVFTRSGCSLYLKTDRLSLSGELRFGPFASPGGDIMGPFRFLPRMECRHSVLSMWHTAEGCLTVNGVPLKFQGGTGYLEGDRGSSFPRRYLWTQCLHGEDSIMLSAAEIPLWGRTFTGCVGFVFTGGREYRIATYRGVKLLKITPNALSLRQGELTVRAEFLGGDFHPLRAPDRGVMSRTVRESSACRVRYVCTLRGDTLLDFVSGQASFETNWDAAGGTSGFRTGRREF